MFDDLMKSEARGSLGVGRRRFRFGASLAATTVLALGLAACGGGGGDDIKVAAAAPSMAKALDASSAVVYGAVFTTDSTCTTVNGNNYALKKDVYLNGGPQQGSAAGLPDGDYYVQVTTPPTHDTPAGLVLGKTTTASVNVSDGKFASCVPLIDILTNTDASDTAGFGSPGYGNTTNPGCVYKAWVSKNPLFPPSESKTDNFRVCKDDGTIITDPLGTLTVTKFYDANADGIQDGAESDITGWAVGITDVNIPGSTFYATTPYSASTLNGDYTVNELLANEANWHPTMATTIGPNDVVTAQTRSFKFGNVCVGNTGGGKTMGYWSNNNGQADFGTYGGLAVVRALPLFNDKGVSVNQLPSYTAYRGWLLKATATNMAYMLGAQLSAMELNVASHKVLGSSVIYAPGVTGANGFGFMSIDTLMSSAIAALALPGNLTVTASALRTQQEAIKTALDKANQDASTSFVFPTAESCPFTFTVPTTSTN